MRRGGVGFVRMFWLVILAACCVGVYERFFDKPVTQPAPAVPEVKHGVPAGSQHHRRPHDYTAEARRLAWTINQVDTNDQYQPYPVDAELQQAALAALEARSSTGLGGADIKLASLHRVIYLTGTVPTLEELDLAVALAGAVPGVIAVHNNLAVEP
jgi:hypothetical protein